jgi:hypothetical protein
MKNINLEVRLNEKSLHANEKVFNLDNSFFSAEISRPLDTENKNERALTLYYKGEKETIPEEELENIYYFLEEQKLVDRINVSSSEYGFPNVSLFGKMDVKIYS